jgi:hypothetical protein
VTRGNFGNLNFKLKPELEGQTENAGLCGRLLLVVGWGLGTILKEPKNQTDKTQADSYSEVELKSRGLLHCSTGDFSTVIRTFQVTGPRRQGQLLQCSL